MATLLVGPRLGSPASAGFKLWAKFDGPATIALETKLTTETTWTSQDSQAVDTAKSNTVVLEASGLQAKTSYDYRILEGETQLFTEETMTMPTTGRFVVYHASDWHAQAISGGISAFILTDWETNYKPLGIPAVSTYIGDFVNLLAETLGSAVVEVSDELEKHCGVGLLWSRVPMLYQFSDWDWAGNNSSNTAAAFSGEGDPLQAAYDLQDHIWRDRGQPAAPSYAHTHEIAGVPLIFADTRSQRVPQNSANPINENILGDNGIGDQYGDAQLAYLKTQFQTYGHRALVLFFHTDTFTDKRTPVVPGGAAQRDSTGAFYQMKRNELINEGMLGYGYESRNNLLILSGDDHRNCLFQGLAGGPTRWDMEAGRTKPPYRLPFREGKCNGTQGPAVGGSKLLFGRGQLFDGFGTGNRSIIRLEISSTKGGTNVEARLTWVDTDNGFTLVQDTLASGLNTIGDLYFDNGVYSAYQGSGIQESGTQFFPAENSNEPKPTFSKAYIDDVLGTVHPRERVERDDYNRIRRIEDIGEADRDELRLRHRGRTERPLDPVR